LLPAALAPAFGALPDDDVLAARVPDRDLAGDALARMRQMMSRGAILSEG
jgi:hypothetical protein